MARTGLQQAGEVAQTAYAAVKTELQESADSGASASDRVESAVHAGMSAARKDDGIETPA